MSNPCGQPLSFTPPLRGGSFPLPSEGDRLKTSVFTRPLKRDSSTLQHSQDGLPSLIGLLLSHRCTYVTTEWLCADP